MSIKYWDTIVGDWCAGRILNIKNCTEDELPMSKHSEIVQVKRSYSVMIPNVLQYLHVIVSSLITCAPIGHVGREPRVE